MRTHRTNGRGQVVAALVAAVCALVAARPQADVAATATWRIANGVTAVTTSGNLVYAAGTFTQLFSPSSSQDQFYDFISGQVRADCARSTGTDRALSGYPDNHGGLLVPVQAGDTFADIAGAFTPAAGATVVRIAETCLWDRQFGTPAIDPLSPDDASIGIPARAGARVVLSNAVIGPDLISLRAQAASFDATSGSRLNYRYYDGKSEVGVIGATATRIVVRVRAGVVGNFTLGALDPVTLELTETAVVLADESIGARSWVRGDVLYRLRPAPSNRLEAYDLTTLQAKAGWTAPTVTALGDLEVVGGRVFLAARVVNGQTLSPPAALNATSGAIDAAWLPPLLTRRVPDPSGIPYVPTLTTLASDGQRLYFAGDFERVGGTDRDGVAALSVASAGLDAWDPAPLLVSPLDVTATALLATRPVGTNRVARRYLAAIDRTTGIATDWNPNDATRVLQHTPSPVSAVAADAGFLYFASATTGEVRRADQTSGDVDPTWRAVVTRADGSPGVVTSMVTANGFVYLGGDFGRIAGAAFAVTPRASVAAVGVDGRLGSFAPVLEGPNGATVRALLALDATIYLGGDFATLDGQSRLGFAAVDGLTGVLSQPEMFVFGETSVNGLATDGLRTYVAGVSFLAPLVGAVSVPDSLLTQFGPTNNVVPPSAAFVAGRLYAGQEYDPETGTPTDRATRWGKVVGDATGLVHVLDDGTLEYYAALPGNPPGAPVLEATSIDNVVFASWTPSASGGAATNYTLFAGSAPGTANLAAIPIRGATRFTATAPTGLYYLTVVARNGYGASAPSNEVPVQVGCLAAPPAPGTLSFLTAGSTVALGWSRALSASSYVIEAGQAPGVMNIGSIPLGNVTSFTTAAPLATYYVRVRAANRCGVSAPSNEVAIRLDGTTSRPAAPTAFVSAVDGRTVTLEWTPATTGGLPSSFQVEAGLTPGGVITGFPWASTRVVIPNAPPGTFYVRVRAINAAGASAATADAVVVVPGA